MDRNEPIPPEAGPAPAVKEWEELNERIVAVMAATIEARDRHTGGHVERVREVAVATARAMGVSGSELDAVRIGAMVHDAGKMAVPMSLLRKPGKLTAEEFERIKVHVLVGAEILESMRFPFPVVEAVRAHHERWDGNGYPMGLAGADIPLAARILALADAFDAFTSDRPFRPAMSEEEALRFLGSQTGHQFDPTVVEAFLRAYPTIQAAIESARPGGPAAQVRISSDALSHIARAAEGAAPPAD